MSHYYKAEAVYKIAVERGFEGHWNGSLSSAINALTSTYGGHSDATVDSVAFEKLGEAMVASLTEGTGSEETGTETPTEPTVTEPEGNGTDNETPSEPEGNGTGGE